MLQHADLAISRAGASALTELAISGTPAILIPFPHASDNHQEANANCAAELGAALVIHQYFSTHTTLEDAIFRLLKFRLSSELSSEDLLVSMREGMKRLFIRDADRKLVKLLSEFI